MSKDKRFILWCALIIGLMAISIIGTVLEGNKRRARHEETMKILNDTNAKLIKLNRWLDEQNAKPRNK